MDTLDFEPIFKQRAIVVQSAADKQHDPVIMIAELGPGESGPPAHIHPTQQETYEVLEGEAEFLLAGKPILVKQVKRSTSRPTRPTPSRIKPMAGLKCVIPINLPSVLRR